MKAINDNFSQIVKCLGDGKYHDGTSIGEQLGISRAAVWKAMKKLEQYGVPLQSVKGKGYCLEKPVSLLDAKAIKSKLKNNAIEVEVVEKVDSTNTYLRQSAKNNKKIKVFLAEMQTQGRGRLQRTWHSPFAKNIYCSLLFPFAKDVGELSGLSLVVALAICAAIEKAIHLQEHQLSVKWPNDILVNGEKLAGVLIELQAESNGFCQLIIGVGVNVNMEKALNKDINQVWTSLFKLTHGYHDRNVIVSEIVATLLDYLQQFSRHGLAHFLDEWQKRDYLVNKQVTVMVNDKKQQGKCIGINEHGHIVLRAVGHKPQAFSSGDATLLK